MSQTAIKIPLIPISAFSGEKDLKTAVLTVRLEEELYLDFKDFIENKVQTSVSSFIRTLALQYLSEYSDNPKYKSRRSTGIYGDKESARQAIKTLKAKKKK